MILFDVQQRSVLAEISTPYVKYVVWNSDMSMVALLCKHAIIIADKKLQNAQTVHETIRVKVGGRNDPEVCNDDRIQLQMFRNFNPSRCLPLLTLCALIL